MLLEAVLATDLPQGADALYFPEGVLDLLAYWSESLDAAAEERLAATNLSEMKIRDKVTQGVLARLEAIGPHEDSARRAMARLLQCLLVCLPG